MSWDGFVDGLRSFVVWVMDVSSVPVLVYFILVNTSLLLLIGLAYLEFRAQQRRRATEPLRVHALPRCGIATLVPFASRSIALVAALSAAVPAGLSRKWRRALPPRTA